MLLNDIRNDYRKRPRVYEFSLSFASLNSLTKT